MAMDPQVRQGRNRKIVFWSTQFMPNSPPEIIGINRCIFIGTQRGSILRGGGIQTEGNAQQKHAADHSQTAAQIIRKFPPGKILQNT